MTKGATEHGAGEALRRRLYRPGAGDADVDAYLAASASDPDPGPAPAPPPRPGSGRWSPAGAGVLVVLLVVALALVAPRLGAHPAATRATPLPTRSVPASTAARFVAALDAGHDAGLGPWWDPDAPFLEQHGAGDATVALPASGSTAGGGLVVLLVLARDGTAGWRTARFVITEQRAVLLQREAGATGALRTGVPAVARIAYPADHRPLRLLVHAPAGTRWGVAVIFTR